MILSDRIVYDIVLVLKINHKLLKQIISQILNDLQTEP